MRTRVPFYESSSLLARMVSDIHGTMTLFYLHKSGLNLIHPGKNCGDTVAKDVGF